MLSRVLANGFLLRNITTTLAKGAAPFSNVACSSLTRQLSSLAISSPKPIIHEQSSLKRLCAPFTNSGLIMQQQRTLVKVSNKGKKKTVKMIISRFRRLGNGMWVRRQGGYKKRLYTKFFNPTGARKVLRKKRHIVCDVRQSTLLDKMVTDYYKKQKWYVSDPYKGYEPHCNFWYHPLDLPKEHQQAANPQFNARYRPRKKRMGDEARGEMKASNKASRRCSMQTNRTKSLVGRHFINI